MYATLLINYAPLPDVLGSDQFFEAIALTDYAPERVPLFTYTRGVFGRIGDAYSMTQCEGQRRRYGCPSPVWPGATAA